MCCHLEAASENREDQSDLRDLDRYGNPDSGGEVSASLLNAIYLNMLAKPSLTELGNPFLIEKMDIYALH